MPFTEPVRNVIIKKISGKRRVNFMDTKKTLKILAGAALIAVFFPLKLKREYNGDFIYETPVFAYKAFTDFQGRHRKAFTIPSASLTKLVDKMLKESLEKDA